MSSYWKDYFDSASKNFEESPLKQVGKTVNGHEVSEHHVKLIVDNIVRVLQLGADDSVVDLCCGNGLITRHLAPLVKEIVAVDFSSGLIEAANRYNSYDNIRYIASDVLAIGPEYYTGPKKVMMYEALQLFSEEQFCILLDQMNGLNPGALVFFGSVPDKEKFNIYYDTEEKLAFQKKREQEGKPHMGKWWPMSEIERCASSRGFKATLLPQNPDLYTAYYRYDVLLEKV